MNDLYTFVYRGVLTDESLDKAGRRTRASFGPADAERIKRALSFDLLDVERLASAERMALIYTAIHAFENSVRHFVSRAMAEHYQEDWWTKVPPKVQAKAKTRIEEEAKFRWHGASRRRRHRVLRLWRSVLNHHRQLGGLRGYLGRSRVGQGDIKCP